MPGDFAMDVALRNTFIERWRRYFGAAELPISFYYTDESGHGAPAPPPRDHECVLAPLARVRHGESLQFESTTVGCDGGKRYFGFTQQLRPEFEYFLSCGIPGKLEGERYKRSPELVREFVQRAPCFQAPGRYIVFKRWDALTAADNPEAVVFFARPDVVSGLFTLANFDQVTVHGVVAPFAAGCGSIVQYPYLERDAEAPRAILGMFDVSARPYVPSDILTFAVPMRKFTSMVRNMEESFLITHSWEKVRQRLP
jgi:uncharacterized protein (DUF169 family)